MKISIFLAEDELIIRENIKNNIEWEKQGFDFLGAAADGELALPIILEKKPDILISDIKMPFLDGLQLATIVKKKLPSTKIIFLTGYKEFDLAQKAINIGVTDYLLKPITTNRLVTLLKELALEIESERENEKLLQQYKAEMNEKKLFSKNQFFIDLISNKYSLSQILDKSKIYDIDLVGNNYAIMLLKLTFYNKNLENEQLYNEIGESLPIEKDWLLFNRGDEGFGIICKNINKDKWNDYQKTLSKFLNQYSQLYYFGALGPIINRISEINQSYKAANKAFALRFFINKTNIISDYQDLYMLEEKEISISFDKLNNNKIDRTYIKRFLKLGEQNEIADFINEYINNKNKNAIDSSSFRYYLLMDTCICCSEFLTSIGISKDDLEKLSIAGAQAITFDKFIDSFDDIIRQSLKLRDSISWGKHKEIIEKTKDFMQKNYNNKEISLNYVSDEMGISSTYLSTIFSTETNETFIEYLTKLRIEKAKDLLLTTELRSSEIAFYIGYQDAHYFSYLFKKYTKMSPRDFKRRSN